MKRILIAFSFLFLSIGIYGVAKYEFVYNERCKPEKIIIKGYPDSSIDRFDTCSNLSHLLYISYRFDDQVYAFIANIRERAIVYKPMSFCDLRDGIFSFWEWANVEKVYEDELSSEIELKESERNFYDNMPDGFKYLKRFCLKSRNFCLTINMFEQKVIFEVHSRSKVVAKYGELVSFYYL